MCIRDRHATIRPFVLTDEEVAAAPDTLKVAPKPFLKTDYKYALTVSPLDCMAVSYTHLDVYKRQP